MNQSRGIDYGWFFLRLGIGLIFISRGADHFDINNIELFSLAQLIAGISLLLGLLVRPAVLFMLVMMVAVFVSGSHLEFKLVRENLTDLLCLIGFLLGGGGSFLALGTAVSGLNGKWYQ